MKYFLRFTNTAQEDLKRGTSIHGQEDSDNFEVLNGLCGYALEASTIEDAIDEIQNGIYQFSYIGKAILFEGKMSKDCNLVPDGDLFIPKSIICEVEI